VPAPADDDAGDAGDAGKGADRRMAADHAATPGAGPPEPLRPSDAVAALKHDLGRLRARRGAPSFRGLAERAGYSHTVLSQAVSGRTLPTWPVTAAFVRACGDDPTGWRARWETAAAARRPRAAQPAASGRAEPDSVRGFAAELAARLDRSRRSRREISTRAGWAQSTVSAALTGRRLPREPLLRDLLRTVGASDEEVGVWLGRRARLATIAETVRLQDRIHVITAGAPAHVPAPALRPAPAFGPAPALRPAPERPVSAEPPLVPLRPRRFEFVRAVGLFGGGAVLAAATDLLVRALLGHPPALLHGQAMTLTPGTVPGVVLDNSPQYAHSTLQSVRPQAPALGPGREVAVVCRVVDGEPAPHDGRSSTEWVRLRDPSTFLPVGRVRVDGPLPQCPRGEERAAAHRYRPRHAARPSPSPHLVRRPTWQSPPDSRFLIDVGPNITYKMGISVLTQRIA
jgi:hypothetical protein